MFHLPQVKSIHLASANSLPKSSACLTVIAIDESAIVDGKIVLDALKQLDVEFEGTITDLVSCGDFTGKWLESSVSLSTNRKISKRVVLIGAGKKVDYAPARTRQIGIKAAEVALSIKAKEVLFVGACASLFADSEAYLQARVGMGMGSYRYPNSNMSAEEKNNLESPLHVTFINAFPDFSEKLKTHEPVNDSIRICRLLQDGPPNIVTPKYVSGCILEEAQKLGLQVQIFGAQKLKEMGFNAMLAVAGGSAQEPQFVVVEYKPAHFKKTIAFVGKGLTMDTGGYSIKTPSTNQEGMKYDMSGAAVCLTSILAIAKLNLPVHVYAVGALCENMVDAHAFRVGDVITSYSGKTIEIIDTDAEGRVVLSDALHYAAKDLKPDCIVEYSTLTGAMLVALGHVGAGVFAFDNDLEKRVMDASHKTGERAYPFPVWEEVASEVKGTISDVCNLHTSRRFAGSMAAAAFLKEFVADVPYAHIDIAGVSDGNQAIGYVRKGGSGYGVQLSIEIARSLSVYLE